MGLLSSFDPKSYLIIVLFFGLIGGGAFLFYTTTQSKISSLTLENSTLLANIDKYKNSYQVCETTLKNLSEDFEENAKLVTKLNKEANEAEKYQDELLKKLQKHDLTRLSIEKPAMVEKRMNDGNEKLLKNIESLSFAID